MLRRRGAYVSYAFGVSASGHRRDHRDEGVRHRCLGLQATAKGPRTPRSSLIPILGVAENGDPEARTTVTFETRERAAPRAARAGIVAAGIVGDTYFVGCSSSATSRRLAPRMP